MTDAMKSISLALRAPNSHTWPWYSTPPIPMRTTGSEKRALSAATMRSQGQHNMSPPAMHAPWTAAIDGLGMSRHLREKPR